MTGMEAMAPIWAALGIDPGAMVLAFMRITGLVMLVPGFGERMLPVRIRLAGSFALTLIVAPLLDAPAPPVTHGLVLSEVAVGAMLGAVLRMAMSALTMAGAVAAQSTSLAQIFGATQMEASSAIGHTLHVAGLALIMATGLHVLLIDLLVRSWDVFPAGALLPGSGVAEWGVTRAGSAFALALGLASPFVIAAVLYNLALGVINKAMPQLMVALVGAPAITGLSLVLFAACAALMLTVWRERFIDLLADPLLPG